MNYLKGVITGVKHVYDELNPATLSGAIDIIVIEQEDGTLLSSPFHVRFGKINIFRSREKVVNIEVNGEPVELKMKLGDAGEAFFVTVTNDYVPDSLATSPILAPLELDALGDMEPFLLDSESGVVNSNPLDPTAPIECQSEIGGGDTDMGRRRASSYSPGDVPEPYIEDNKTKCTTGQNPLAFEQQTVSMEHVPRHKSNPQISWGWGKLPEENASTTDYQSLPSSPVTERREGDNAILPSSEMSSMAGFTLDGTPTSGLLHSGLSSSSLSAKQQNRSWVGSIFNMFKREERLPPEGGMFLSSIGQEDMQVPGGADNADDLTNDTIEGVDGPSAPIAMVEMESSNEVTSLTGVDQIPPVTKSLQAIESSTTAEPTSLEDPSSSPNHHSNEAIATHPPPSPPIATPLSLPPVTEEIAGENEGNKAIWVENIEDDTDQFNPSAKTTPETLSCGDEANQIEPLRHIDQSVQSDEVSLVGSAEILNKSGVNEAIDKRVVLASTPPIDPPNPIDPIALEANDVSFDPEAAESLQGLENVIKEVDMMKEEKTNIEGEVSEKKDATILSQKVNTDVMPDTDTRGEKTNIDEMEDKLPKGFDDKSRDKDRMEKHRPRMQRIDTVFFDTLSIENVPDNKAVPTNTVPAALPMAVTPQKDLSVQMSLCGNILKTMTAEDIKEQFDNHLVNFEQFCERPELMNDSNLVLRINGKYYDWKIGGPLIMSYVMFHQPLSDQSMEQLSVRYAQQEGWTRWLFGSKQSTVSSPVKKSMPSDGLNRSNTLPLAMPSSSPLANPNRDNISLKQLEPSQFAMELDDNRLIGVGRSRAQSMDEYPVPFGSPAMTEEGPYRDDTAVEVPTTYYRKTLRPSPEQLASLNLQPGLSTIRFTVVTKLQGTATCESTIYKWRYDDKIIISDIDGTITKSDALGHILYALGQDWTHNGVASLYSQIYNNGYRLLYLSSRAIGQADITRYYLNGVRQKGCCLPQGPVLLSPDRLMTSFHREVIRKKPEEFKIACLRDIRSLFPANVNPFYGGFGNRITDDVSYRAVGVPQARIFIINSTGEIKTEHHITFRSSYQSLSELVDHMFPTVVNTNGADQDAVVGEEFNDFNYWKVPMSKFADLEPLPDMDLKITRTKTAESASQPSP
eukprot:Ihof_evm1s239 gene=Ihof_evmTU1s239